MATISRPNSYTTNTTIEPSQVNDDFNTIYNDHNGNITNANIAADAAIDESKLSIANLSGLITQQGWEPVTSDTTINSGTETDLTGATVTLTPAVDSYVEVIAYFNFSGSTAGTDQFTFHVDIDGTNVESIRATVNQSSGFMSATIAYLGEIDDTEHVIKIQGVRTSGSNSISVKGGLSGFTYKVWNK